MAQRDNRRLGCWHAPPRRRPVGPVSGVAQTPRGPDQVNVLLLLLSMGYRAVRRLFYPVFLPE
jgi:hypothetical protein